MVGGYLTYELKIIAASDNPVFAGNKPPCTNRHICDVKRPHQRRGLVIVEVDFAIVQSAEDPGLCGVEIDGLDAIGAAG